MERDYDARRERSRKDPSRREQREHGDDDRDQRHFGDDRYRDERTGREHWQGEGGRREHERWGDRPQEPDEDRAYRRRGSLGSGRDEARRGRGGEQEGSRFELDEWSQRSAEPRYSDDPYYARNRGYERSRSSESSRDESGKWRGDENRRTTPEQRERGLTPREEYGIRNREDDEGMHYRGYYARESRPFSYPGGSGYLYMESWALSGPYTGRGPKGYKRSDEQIIEEACQRLERDGQVDATEIEVNAEDGVIRLRGTVPERSMKRRAEESVESIYGVRDVMNELRVAPQGGEESQTQRGSRESKDSRKSKAASAAAAGSPAEETRGGAASSPQRSVGDQKSPKP